MTWRVGLTFACLYPGVLARLWHDVCVDCGVWRFTGVIRNVEGTHHAVWKEEGWGVNKGNCRYRRRLTMPRLVFSAETRRWFVIGHESSEHRLSKRFCDANPTMRLAAAAQPCGISGQRKGLAGIKP